MDYPTLYKKLGQGFDTILVEIAAGNPVVHLAKTLLQMITDLSEDDDLDAVPIAVSFLYPIREVVQSLIHNPLAITPIIKAAGIINNFTDDYIGVQSLSDFVNSVDWDDNCVPVEWSTVSEYLGTDISDWNVCDPASDESLCIGCITSVSTPFTFWDEE